MYSEHKRVKKTAIEKKERNSHTLKTPASLQQF